MTKAVRNKDEESPRLAAVCGFAYVGFLCYGFYFVILPAAWGNSP